MVYCTCPSDETSRSILEKALTLGFSPNQVSEGWIGGVEVEGLSGRAL